MLLSVLSAGGWAQAEVPPKDNLIKISFFLRTAGFVTLVVERPDGTRVRNLVSETWYPAGRNNIYWDAKDDLKRDADAASRGVYHVPGTFVAPGTYRIRGLVRGKIRPIYEFSVYASGSPPWSTKDHTGGWLANHSAPMSALYVPTSHSPAGRPSVVLGCYITEGPDGIVWVDLNGNKLGGKKWLGGAWTAAPFLAKDEGENQVPGDLFYAASVWGESKGLVRDRELRVTALTMKRDRKVAVLRLAGEGIAAARPQDCMGGIAANNGLLVVSLPILNELIFIRASDGNVIDTVRVKSPRGLVFDSSGNLLLISERSVLRYKRGVGGEPEELITSGLVAPFGITVDDQSRIYVSDRGESNQVKVFSPDGQLIRSIGTPGPPASGKYDPLHMNNPAGLAVDPEGKIWVTEQDVLPKRVSVWNQDGSFFKAFYGPAKYGGGGTLDPNDKSKFYYSEGAGTMQFKLDWQQGAYSLEKVLLRRQRVDSVRAYKSSAPETPIIFEGYRYFTNCYNTNPTNGHGTAFLYQERRGTLYPVAAAGRAAEWDILSSPRFLKDIPGNVYLKSKPGRKIFFLWSDINSNGKPDPGEVSFLAASAAGITVMPNLSFCVSNLDGKAVVFRSRRLTGDGVPVYDLRDSAVLVSGVLPPASTGGGQVLLFPDGHSIVTLGVKPGEQLSVSGMKDGVLKWTYPSLWPGLHASHSAPSPQFRGELIGTTRILGPPFAVKPDVTLWALNGNHGCVYIFTSDGLFVASVFDVIRRGKRWSMDRAVRGMELSNVTLGEENFWPTITKTSDGEVYMVDGDRSSIVHLEGIKNITRLPNQQVYVSSGTIARIKSYFLSQEVQRQKGEQNKLLLSVAIRDDSIRTDGVLNEWTRSAFVEIDKGDGQPSAMHKKANRGVTAALAISGDRLCVAYRTGNPALLRNSGEIANALFKTGGALDLMLSVKSAVYAPKKTTGEGDLRLVVTRVKGRLQAVLYESMVPGTLPANRTAFSSPSQTVYFDRVRDVSQYVRLGEKAGDYEISIPLALLDLKPIPGMEIKGDVGILRGDGAETVARLYWANKAAGQTADLPSEALLNPSLWGILHFVADDVRSPGKDSEKRSEAR